MIARTMAAIQQNVVLNQCRRHRWSPDKGQWKQLTTFILWTV